MNIQFATCNRVIALGYLQKLYPDRSITDTPESAKPLLDIVEKDIIRIPDPDMHGKQVGVCPSKNWDEAKETEYIKILQAFHDKYK